MKRILGIMVMGMMCIGLAACGSSGGTATPATDDTTTADLTENLKSLADIPETSEMFKTNSAASTSIAKSLKAVVGTAPLLTSISATNVDTYFWNGLVATINTAGAATEDQAQQFWGEGADGTAGGELACRMAQTTGYTMQQLIMAGTSLCYMKGMPTAVSEDAVTTTLEDLTPANIFDSTAADKLVRVHATGGNENIMEGGDQYIFLNVLGTDTIGTEAYKVVIYMCDSLTGSPNQYNVITANMSSSEAAIDGVTVPATSLKVLDTGTMTFGGQEETIASEVTGKLKVDTDGTITFDETANRSSTFSFAMGNMTMKSEIVVTPENQITTKEYMDETTTCSNKVYALIGFTGSSLTDLRFAEAGTQGEADCSAAGADQTFTFGGGVEYQNTHYVVTTTSSYATTAEAFTFASDGFYTSAPSTPTVDTTALSTATTFSCAATPDVTVDMNMANTAIAAVATTCEAAMMSNMNWCDTGDIQTARNTIMDIGGGGGDQIAIPDACAAVCPNGLDDLEDATCLACVVTYCTDTDPTDAICQYAQQ